MIKRKRQADQDYDDGGNDNEELWDKHKARVRFLILIMVAGRERLGITSGKGAGCKEDRW